VNRAGDGITTDRYEMTIVDFKNIGYKDEPFVLGKDVTQVFYVKDMASTSKKNQGKSDDKPKHHIILLGKIKIIGVEDISDNSEDFDQFDDHDQETFVKRKVNNVQECRPSISNRVG
jgi:hypothetical protein